MIRKISELKVGDAVWLRENRPLEAMPCIVKAAVEALDAEKDGYTCPAIIVRNSNGSSGVVRESSLSNNSPNYFRHRLSKDPAEIIKSVLKELIPPEVTMEMLLRAVEGFCADRGGN